MILFAVLAVGLAGWWLYDHAWQRGFKYGYDAGLLANDKLNIYFEPEDWK